MCQLNVRYILYLGSHDKIIYIIIVIYLDHDFIFKQ